MTKLRYGPFVVGMTLTWAATAMAVDPDVKCLSSKFKEAGKYYSCRLKVESKATTRGETADFARCEEKLTVKWSRIEEKAGRSCPTTPDDLEAIQGQWGLYEAALNNILQLSCALTGSCRVFVTSVTYTANLGGLAGADSRCQLHAAVGGLPGVYRAWLSEESSAASPDTKFTKSPGSYVRTDGAPLADNWADLTDGVLDNPINRNEVGNLQVGEDKVFTCTFPDGTNSFISFPTLPDACCDDWTSDSSIGAGSVGDMTTTVANWTSHSGTGCDDKRRLYCFQQ